MMVFQMFRVTMIPAYTVTKADLAGDLKGSKFKGDISI